MSALLFVIMLKLRRVTWLSKQPKFLPNWSFRTFSSLPDMQEIDDTPHEPLSPLNFNNPRESFRTKTNIELLRSYLVFKSCLIPPLVKHSDKIHNLMRKFCGDRITDFVMKKTFFGHFCAGEDHEDIRPTIHRLDHSGIGSILDYAAEADIVDDDKKEHRGEGSSLAKVRVYDYHNETLCDQHVKTFESCLRSSHSVRGINNRGFAAVKITALGDPELLKRVSTAITEIRNLFIRFDVDGSGVITKKEFAQQYNKIFTGGDVEKVFASMDLDGDDKIDYIEWSNSITIEELHNLTSHCRTKGPLARATLTEEERNLLLNLRSRIEHLAKLTVELGVHMMIDAEHTYFQPAIDNIANTLMKRHNIHYPAIFSTYQMYLVDSSQRLKTDMERASKGGYYFAAKLVRGAYMELERNRAKELDIPDPIHPTLQATHDNYNNCMEYVLSKIAEGEKVEVMFATHNQESIERCIALMHKYKLTPQHGVYFAQLLGMADHLSYTLGLASYKAYKYVPYGKVREVMPYLSRRAQENSSVLGNVGLEISMARDELLRRLFGSKK